MEKFKEFQGKDLDEAIQKACDFFDCTREKMEIEILQDAKSGIFGIVGARKAKIRARRTQLRDAVESVLGKKHDAPVDTPAEPATEKAPRIDVPERETRREQPQKQRKTGLAPEDAPGEQSASATPESAQPASGNKTEKPAGASSYGRHHAEKRASIKSAHRHEKTRELEEDASEDLEELEDDLPVRPLEEMDTQRLGDVVAEVVSRLVSPIAGKDVTVKVEVGHGRVRAKVDWEGDACLLIGREGLTLVALQYLASRMVSRAMNMALRVQLDIGDYHKRQDDRLRETARALADKARRTGKSWSTRPLSSYHRRIIHLSLQGEPDVQTRSSGEGPLKRVVISPRKNVDHDGEE